MKPSSSVLEACARINEELTARGFPAPSMGDPNLASMDRILFALKTMGAVYDDVKGLIGELIDFRLPPK